ncbi:methyl-CpG-binding domain-containing protein 2-like [Hordeum vulgare subsp. vulgare]|uniref:methyl-CpG-binding domain-containing protein 2-like n=1 Tax=Hordeum vulgare subsp. vulgare TaxID=112509 RepID=UPI001D1A446D|nr:methyl-CpG-binding domain-containing protein 2-like [Hordeum vulgare subsp. vulgare]
MAARSAYKTPLVPTYLLTFSIALASSLRPVPAEWQRRDKSAPTPPTPHGPLRRLLRIPRPTPRKQSYLTRNFRGHNPEKGMVHPRKRSRKRLVTGDSDDDDYTDKDYSIEEDASKQLVLYDQTTRRQQREFQLAEPIYDSTPLQQIPPKTRFGGHSRVLPSIAHYTVQCAQCFKWRVVPTKEKYEELRETISEELFECARAREWNRVLSCDDPEDMSQDGSRVWAIDKPNIAQTPLGWNREVRIRGLGCSKFADVYYTSPAGTTLRSMVEIERYLAENPFYIRQGVYLGQFSFATPKPLEEGYVRKRKYSATTCELPDILEPVEVNPLCWAAPPTRRELLQMGASASNPVEVDGKPEVFETPPMHTNRRNLNQAVPSSGGRKKRAASSGEPKKRTMKQAS